MAELIVPSGAVMQRLETSAELVRSDSWQQRGSGNPLSPLHSIKARIVAAAVRPADSQAIYVVYQHGLVKRWELDTDRMRNWLDRRTAVATLSSADNSSSAPVDRRDLHDLVFSQPAFDTGAVRAYYSFDMRKPSPTEQTTKGGQAKPYDHDMCLFGALLPPVHQLDPPANEFGAHFMIWEVRFDTAYECGGKLAVSATNQEHVFVGIGAGNVRTLGRTDDINDPYAKLWRIWAPWSPDDAEREYVSLIDNTYDRFVLKMTGLRDPIDVSASPYSRVVTVVDVGTPITADRVRSVPRTRSLSWTADIVATAIRRNNTRIALADNCDLYEQAADGTVTHIFTNIGDEMPNAEPAALVVTECDTVYIFANDPIERTNLFYRVTPWR